MQQPEWIRTPENSLNVCAKWHNHYQSCKADAKLTLSGGKALRIWGWDKAKIPLGPEGLRTRTHRELKRESLLWAVCDCIHRTRQIRLQPPLQLVARAPKKAASYLVFLNLCPEGVEFLQSQLTAPVVLLWVKVISLEGRKRVFPSMHWVYLLNI